MRRLLSFIIPLFSSLTYLVTAHNIHIEARRRGNPPNSIIPNPILIRLECFFEDLHRDDKMTVTFLAGPSEEGNNDIDFWVLFFSFKVTFQITGPSGIQIVKEERMQNGDYSFTATEDGTFRYCFSNVLLMSWVYTHFLGIREFWC
jgi:p24 family protein beta-1